MTTESLNKLQQLLLSFSYAKYASNKRQIVIRCPFCGDSRKHRDSTHFYIKVNVNINVNEMPVYYCQRCQQTGIVNSSFLRNIRVFDHEIISDLNKYISKASKDKSNKKYKIGEKIKLKNPTPSNSQLSIDKIMYLNDRLGLKLSVDDILKFKICLNLYDLLDYNKISNLTRKEEFCDILDKHYIGFISYDNAYINFRKIDDKIDTERYVNYNIFGKYDNQKRFYVIPTKIDIMNPEPVTINITEGVIDTLSVFFHVMNCNNYNSIYTAVGGIGYQNILNYFINYGFIHHNINIFSDNDVNINDYKRLKEDMDGKIDGNINIFYNSHNGEKDFGVPKEKIKIIKSRI